MKISCGKLDTKRIINNGVGFRLSSNYNWYSKCKQSGLISFKLLKTITVPQTQSKIISHENIVVKGVNNLKIYDYDLSLKSNITISLNFEYDTNNNKVSIIANSAASILYANIFEFDSSYNATVATITTPDFNVPYQGTNISLYEDSLSIGIPGTGNNSAGDVLIYQKASSTSWLQVDKISGAFPHYQIGKINKLYDNNLILSYDLTGVDISTTSMLYTRPNTNASFSFSKYLFKTTPDTGSPGPNNDTADIDGDIYVRTSGNETAIFVFNVTSSTGSAQQIININYLIRSVKLYDDTLAVLKQNDEVDIHKKQGSEFVHTQTIGTFSSIDVFENYISGINPYVLTVYQEF